MQIVIFLVCTIDSNSAYHARHSNGLCMAWKSEILLSALPHFEDFARHCPRVFKPIFAILLKAGTIPFFNNMKTKALAAGFYTLGHILFL